MKRTLFLCLLGVGFVALEAQGALTGLNLALPVGNPGYADFNVNSLRTAYTFNSGTGLGTFSITTLSGPAGEQYTSTSQSPGTGSSPYSNQQFLGSFSMTAFVKNIGGEWQVVNNGSTHSTFSIAGNLINSGNTSDILLNGTLETGSGTFGFGTTSDNEFDFLFNPASGGTDNQAILTDFFGVGTGQGGIKMHVTGGYAGSLTAGWVNSSGGFADAFVPEPVFYPLAAFGMAILGLGLAARKSDRASSLAA